MLVTVEPRMYREAIALAVQRSRPKAEVMLVPEEVLDGQVEDFALKTLLGVLALPEVLGAHTCEECGYLQMRRLPDGVFHCPACCAEVTPVVR